jgi:hypothetical protein
MTGSDGTQGLTGLTNAVANSFELGDAIIQFVPNHLLSMILGWSTMIERMFFVFDCDC